MISGDFCVVGCDAGCVGWCVACEMVFNVMNCDSNSFYHHGEENFVVCVCMLWLYVFVGFRSSSLVGWSFFSLFLKGTLCGAAGQIHWCQLLVGRRC